MQRLKLESYIDYYFHNWYRFPRPYFYVGHYWMIYLYLRHLVVINLSFRLCGLLIIGITQPPPKDGARNALSSNLSKSGLDNYVVKRSKRHLLEEVSWSRLPCPIHRHPIVVYDVISDSGSKNPRPMKPLALDIFTTFILHMCQRDNQISQDAKKCLYKFNKNSKCISWRTS